MSSGAWISEKNPDYPFFAVVFYMIGLFRLTPLFPGALACIGLFAGARAWLGRFAGSLAVWLFCFSGAALVFAWRATMPSFTDASLIAAAFGGLLYVACSTQLSDRRRTLLGLLAFLGLEGAVFIRYPDVVELIVASAASLLLRRAAALSWRSVLVWLGSVVVFGAGVLGFNEWAYGSATSTGYSSGEISFSLTALWPNLKGMPTQLTTSMPLWIPAFVALIWIVVRLGALTFTHSLESKHARCRDAAVATVLGVGWLMMWVLYLTCTWTAGQLGGSSHAGTITVHVIRFYLPVLGCATLLATGLVSRLRSRLSWPVVSALAVAGILSFEAMAGGGGAGAPGQAPTGTSQGQLPPPGFGATTSPASS
jgi:hypothetical protein